MPGTSRIMSAGRGSAIGLVLLSLAFQQGMDKYTFIEANDQIDENNDANSSLQKRRVAV